MDAAPSGTPRTDRLRILFVAAAPEGRTSERSPVVLRILKERHEVLELRPPWDRFVYDPARAKAPRLLLYAVDKILLVIRALWLGRTRRPDAVFCESVHYAVAGLVIARILGARCIWDSHGNGKLLYESLGKGRRATHWIAALERFLGTCVDELITVSERDASEYKAMGLSRSRIHVIPTGAWLREIDAATGGFGTGARPRDRDRPVLLFFGSFAYEPNREALDFVNSVLAPYLEGQGLESEIRIAGRAIPSIPFHPYVRALGFVDDIYGCIRSADLCIVPVRRGVGMLTKVVDAMAVGTPLVLSEFAASGVPDIRHEVHAYVAATDQDFLRCVSNALSDPEAGRTMARRARLLVERKFDWDSYADEMDRIIRRAPEVAVERGTHESRNHHIER